LLIIFRKPPHGFSAFPGLKVRLSESSLNFVPFRFGARRSHPNLRAGLRSLASLKAFFEQGLTRPMSTPRYTDSGSAQPRYNIFRLKFLTFPEAFFRVTGTHETRSGFYYARSCPHGSLLHIVVLRDSCRLLATPAQLPRSIFFEQLFNGSSRLTTGKVYCFASHKLL
jgi:hypothetical protein